MIGDDSTNFASGVFYAILASIFFGSFAVPIKTRAIVKANVDPVAVSCISSLKSHLISYRVVVVQSRLIIIIISLTL